MYILTNSINVNNTTDITTIEDGRVKYKDQQVDKITGKRLKETYFTIRKRIKEITNENLQIIQMNRISELVIVVNGKIIILFMSLKPVWTGSRVKYTGCFK